MKNIGRNARSMKVNACLSVDFGVKRLRSFWPDMAGRLGFGLDITPYIEVQCDQRHYFRVQYTTVGPTAT